MDPLTVSIAALSGPALGGIWLSHRYAWWRPTVSYRWPRVLMYHMITPHRMGARFNGLRVPPSAFEQQLRYLSENGWTFLTMSEATRQWGDTPEKSVVLTFDDGFQDNFLHAFPLLEKYRAKATLYLVCDRFENDWSVNKKAHHQGGELRDEPKLKDEHVHTMLASGLLELGSHTVSHPNLGSLSTPEKQVELRESRARLEQTFQVSVSSFAYPFGIYADTDCDLVRQAGYHNAVTTDTGISEDDVHFQRIKRIKVSGRETLSAFRLRLRTGWRAWNK